MSSKRNKVTYRTPEQRRRIFEKTKGRCFHCQQQLHWRFGSTAVLKPNDFTVDHEIPLAWGGTNDFVNLVPSCYSCNNQKSKKEDPNHRVRKKV